MLYVSFRASTYPGMHQSRHQLNMTSLCEAPWNRCQVIRLIIFVII